MIILGITGSIGTGKSTIASIFKDLGFSVYDSDKIVSALYKEKAVSLIEKVFPASIEKKEVNRVKLFDMISQKSDSLDILESIMHPLVEEELKTIIQFHREKKSRLIVIEIPLLLETGMSKYVNKILVTSLPYTVQKKRVLARKNMTKEKFSMLCARQMNDAEKKKYADYVIETENDLKTIEKKVKEIVANLI